MTLAIETIAVPHANGAVPAPSACDPIPAMPTDRPGSGLYILRETPTEKVVCTNRTTTADASLELLKIRPLPKGCFWVVEGLRPGRTAGCPCPTRPGWNHLEFKVGLLPEKARP